MKWIRRCIADHGKRVALQASTAGATLFGPRRHGCFGILMYHRVAHPSALLPCPPWNVTPDRFQRQMTELRDWGIVVWPLRKLVEYACARKEVPPGVTAITFDDGYGNVYQNAWPVLKSLRIPATVFVTTAYVGQHYPFPFEWWSRRYWSVAPANSWKPLDWQQCRILYDSGLIEIGGHGHTHGDFRGQSGLFKEDFERCLEVLRQEMGISRPAFSFPYGSRELGHVQDAFVRIVEQSQAICALTTEMELIEPRSSPYQWGRMEVTQSDTGKTIKAKLDGWYNWVAWVRKVFRRLSPPPACDAHGVRRNVASQKDKGGRGSRTVITEGDASVVPGETTERSVHGGTRCFSLRLG